MCCVNFCKVDRDISGECICTAGSRSVFEPYDVDSFISCILSQAKHLLWRGQLEVLTVPTCDGNVTIAAGGRKGTIVVVTS